MVVLVVFASSQGEKGTLKTKPTHTLRIVEPDRCQDSQFAPLKDKFGTPARGVRIEFVQEGSLKQGGPRTRRASTGAGKAIAVCS